MRPSGAFETWEFIINCMAFVAIWHLLALYLLCKLDQAFNKWDYE